ncbi:MAG: hypothetical protein J5806_10705 [Lentisphaeria bacterium]|nr:hypothetical protein [Lentisphaeria bacterium]
MKKLFSARKSKRNSRGVAVVFTLGILGLLTVLALGFASTALLNRKIAENVSGQGYARNLARNVALPRAIFQLRKGVPVSSIYSTKRSSDPDSTDFLWKLDTLLTSKGPKLFYTTADNGTAYTTDARWQYVINPADNNRILGRFAYVAVPDSGLDPQENLGTVADRFGTSPKEISLAEGSDEASKWNTKLNSTKPSGSNRWKSFNEIFAALNITEGNENTRKMFTDGISVGQPASSETFWLDLNGDGKRTDNEQFLRFNLTREDWDETTVSDLLGETKSLSTRAEGETSAAGIPWLRNWTRQVDATYWTSERMKNQIAANIIQYNRDATDPTVTDKAEDADWLTDFPSYAGIGRHPMLNEVGFLVRVRTEVETSDITTSADGTTKTITYTPIYYITIDSGAELIYPYGPGNTLQNSEIAFSGTKYSNAIPKMLMRFKLRKFLKRGTAELQNTVDTLTSQNKLIIDGILNSQMLHTDIDDIVIETTGTVTKLVDSSTVITQMSEPGFGWTNCNLTLGHGDWNASPAYTKAGKFWKEDQTGKQQTLKIPIRYLTITTSTSVGNNGDISEAMARRMTIDWLSFTPGNVVLKYDGKQRDAAQLPAIEAAQVPNTTTKFPNQITDMATEKVWFVSYETKDPLVNHYPTDWKRTLSGGMAVWNESTSPRSDYPGTLYSGTSESHLNSTIDDGSTLIDLSDINGAALQEVSVDPAYTTEKRLSTSYVRHGQMKSLWELGGISRAEPFKTLNLFRTKLKDPADTSTGLNSLKAGTFENGDANILDQVKLSDTPTADRLEVYGKVNLNGTNHRAFERLFNTGVNWYESLTNTNTFNPFTSTGTASTLVCSDNTCKMTPCSGTCTSTCLAHLLMERSSILPFSNRSDLLLDPEDANFGSQLPGYSALSTTRKNKLKTAQTNLRNFLLKSGVTSLNKAEREQYATRFMQLFCCEPVKVYLIVVAQTIRDIGGAPAFVDWDGDGEFSGTAEADKKTITADAKYLKTGYVRKNLSGSYEVVGAPGKVAETIASTTVGTYDFGADKISGEAKMIVEMTRDPKTLTWKITGYRYVE